jgi:para-nitrobenzyl esterase
MLLAMPAAHGLFHKAIIQSGPGLRAVSRERATESARKLLAALGVEEGRLEKLETLPAKDIQAAAATLPRQGPMGGFSPCVDGVALPRDPFHPDAPAISASVPVMIGTNKDEATLFLRADPKFGEFTKDDLDKRAKAAAPQKADALVAALRQAHPDYSPTHLACAVQTAVGMWLGSITLAERKAAQNGAPVWMYMLVWETPVARGSLKCPHALEIPLVFDNVEAARNFVGRGEDPQTLAEQMSAAWLAFARTGDPNTPAIPRWPAYDAGARATMIFDVESRIEQDPMTAVREILQG